MNIITALNDLFRYNAPADSVHSIVQQAEAGGPVHHTNIGDGVLADYLEEHDDPRSEIVRRHLKRTEAGISGIMEEMRKRLGGYWESTGFDTKELGNGQYVMRHQYSDNSENGVKVAHVLWSIPKVQSGNRSVRRLYEGIFTPEEAAHIMSRLKHVSEGLPVPID